MSVEWKCDRCSRHHTDNGAMVSHPPESWQAYQLTKVANKHGGDFTSNVIKIAHLCEHCITAIQAKPPDIRFA